MEWCKVRQDRLENKLPSDSIFHLLLAGRWRDRPLTCTDIAVISQYIGKYWELVGLYIGIPDAKMEKIKNKKSRKLLRIAEMLNHWRKSNHPNATYRALCECLIDLPRVSVNWPMITTFIKKQGRREIT